MQRKLLILGYHKIGEPSAGAWNTWYYVPTEIFAAQLTHLQRNGWCAIDAAAFVRGLADPKTLPERSALITFDDGYRCVLDTAAPVLRRFGYPAVMFVPTGYIGATNTFGYGTEPKEPICTWRELAALERSGISVQSHGVTHRPLSDLDEREQLREFLLSRETLEAKLNRPVELFAYPYGDAGANTDSVAAMLQEAGYRAACLYKGKWNPVPPANPYLLLRLAMGPDTDLSKAIG